MYESVLSVVVLGIGMLLWNTKVENIVISRISKHFKKDNGKETTVFIDPR